MKRRNFLIGGVALVGTASASLAKSPTIKNPLPKMPVRHDEATSFIEVKAHRHHKPHFPKYINRPKVKVKLTSYDKAVLVKTAWGETRGESKLGRMAVVHVILNRIYTENPQYKSFKSIAQVCLKKYQFSCWLDKLTMRHIKVDNTFKEVKADVEAAIRAYEHGIDYSNGATLYYSDIISPPKWVSSYNKVNKIGLHNFYA